MSLGSQNVRKMSDEDLKRRMNIYASISGKAARKVYMTALNEAIRREREQEAGR